MLVNYALVKALDVNQSTKNKISGIPYQLVRSRRKTIAIHVYRNGQVEVRAPKQAPRLLVERFLLDKLPWIEKKREEWQALPDPHQLSFKPGSVHYFLGEPHELNFGSDDPALAQITLRPRQRDETSIKRALERWYRQQAFQVFEERHKFWCDQLHHLSLPDSEIKLRKMKARWGSCSRHGTITLNTQLVRYPLPCVDGVIVHELCHLLEFNHSPRFYGLMDQAYPSWKASDKLLKELALQY